MPSPKITIDRSPSLRRDAEIFAFSEEWILEDTRIGGVPGTWINPPPGVRADIMALFCCPNCKTVRALGQGIHTIDDVGLVKPDLQCKNGKCPFHRKVYLDRWNRKPLYACAIERWVHGKYMPEIHYMHATTEREAAFHLGHGKYKIVAIGPAIGFWQSNEKTDTELTA